MMAHIFRVTFTGVDEYTSSFWLQHLSEEFPFVEWAILLSASNGGKENRFPEVRYRTPFVEAFPGPLAVHLCGDFARRAAGDDARDIFGFARILVPGVKRIQLNISDKPEIFLRHVVRKAAIETGLRVIVQTRDFHTPLGYSHPQAIDGRNNWSVPLSLLLDRSGGRGIYEPFRTLPPHLHSPHLPIGFAGGIGPDNVEQVLADIRAMDFPNPVWIDMESKVRTPDDYFDPEKAEQVLRAAAPFITPGGAL